jgi:hypothetical protein
VTAHCHVFPTFLFSPHSNLDKLLNVSLEAFAATEFNEISSGRQPRQAVRVSRGFGNSFPNIMGVLVVWYNQN